jgi:hypothetical protein
VWGWKYRRYFSRSEEGVRGRDIEDKGGEERVSSRDYKV